jgi:hypothetical protein
MENLVDKGMNCYDEPGSWERLSEGWPEVPYTKIRWMFCLNNKDFPYGTYVVVGNEYTYPIKQNDQSYYDYSKAVIRVSTIKQKNLLLEVV